MSSLKLTIFGIKIRTHSRKCLHPSRTLANLQIYMKQLSFDFSIFLLQKGWNKLKVLWMSWILGEMGLTLKQNIADNLNVMLKLY